MLRRRFVEMLNRKGLFGVRQKSSVSSAKSIRFISWRGVGIPVGVGVSVLCYLQFERIKKRQLQSANLPILWSPWKIWVYKRLPLNSMSRVWGWLNCRQIPVWARKPILGFYVWAFNCNLDEAQESDLRRYRNLDEFFRRTLKSGLRPICPDLVVSPADGTVMTFGKMTNGYVEQVKGISYKVETFFGRDLTTELTPSSPNNQIYFCVVYLGPGDYHGFHSPADWNVKLRRHFTGYLLSVGSLVTNKVPDVLCLNERVVLHGNWKHGLFTMTAVGATNVGNISIDFDDELITNQRKRPEALPIVFQDRTFPINSVVKKKGDHIGQFNLGSSVVLIFEAPANFQFACDRGQKVLYGQSLGCVPRK